MFCVLDIDITSPATKPRKLILGIITHDGEAAYVMLVVVVSGGAPTNPHYMHVYVTRRSVDDGIALVA